MTAYGFTGKMFQDADGNVIQISRYYDDDEPMAQIIEQIDTEAQSLGLKAYTPTSGGESGNKSGSNKAYTELLIGAFARDDKENAEQLQKDGNLPAVSPVLHCYAVPRNFEKGPYGKYAEFSIYMDTPEIEKQVEDMLSQFDVTFNDLPFAGSALPRDIENGKVSRREYVPPLPVKAKVIKIHTTRKKDGEVVLDADGNPEMKYIHLWNDRYSDMASEFVGVADAWPYNSIKSMIPADAPIEDAPDDFAPPSGDNDEPFK